ncbi:acetyl-CoA carboxylase biotin carboxyl carrier protein [Allorhizobium undicola]|uniref:acetyl-CoA carboxylase biotin carboxyl carrier protein n=1 Tax=Allorhizobium undicola TaxID=78527 RepID=UPI0004824D09|nr:acetyl-CoA carboxylase biotin carboxyl carrier protein subunit [Allorhizobium undicola]
MDLNKIKILMDYVGQSQLAELRVAQAGTTVVIRNRKPSADAAFPSSPAPQAGSTTVPSEQAVMVRSPVSGIVHKAASPGAPALVQPGDRVEAGQGLCVLEAMKVFTTVPAPVSGRIGRCHFADGADIAAGDILLEIET